MISITLSQPKNINVIVASKEVAFNAVSFKIISIVDNCQNKVIASILLVSDSGKTHPKQVVLWENTTYDEIGNWTQEQANTRILELT